MLDASNEEVKTPCVCNLLTGLLENDLREMVILKKGLVDNCIKYSMYVQYFK